MDHMSSNVGRGGALGTVAAAMFDLVLNSGEFIGLAVSWVVANADLLLPIFSTLRSQIAPRVEWIPTGLVDKLVFAAALLFLAVMLYRLVNRTFGD